jgi:hypothetical protein
MIAKKVDAADDLVALDDGIFDAGKLRIDDVKVGAANAARAYFDPNFAIAGHRMSALLHLQGHSRRQQHHRMH